MPGFFQTANSDGEFFSNSSNYDTVIRATGTSKRIIVGCVENEHDYSSNCSMIITPSEIIVNGSLSVINGNVNGSFVGDVDGNTNGQTDINLDNIIFNSNHSDFLSLFGVKPNHTEFISGLFDIGSLNWQNKWSIDEVLFKNNDNVIPELDNIDETMILSSNILISSDKTSCLDFKQYLNISLYNDRGEYQSNLAIHVNDGLDNTQNNDKFLFIGRLLPDNPMFAKKFSEDFISYYKKYGYVPYLDQNNPNKFIRLPSEKSHIPGTKFYIVEFINTYEKITEDTYYQLDNTDRKNKYFVNNDEKTTNNDNIYHGLYPHITYTRWLNVENPDKVEFRDNIYTSDIWGDLSRDEQDIKNDFYSSHEKNGWMYKLYELTYIFIKHGKEPEHLNINANTPVGKNSFTLLYYFEKNVTDVLGHNLIFESRVNFNDHGIENNINAVSYKDNAFPNEMF